MQERKVVVSRFLTAQRFVPVEKKSPTERVSEFVDRQKDIALYPFSPDFSIKALLGGGKTIGGDKGKNPASDNKEKEKKKLKFRRVGLNCYDPKATQQEGQIINLWPKVNLDGQMGDVANVGWLDAPKLMNPSDYKNQVNYMLNVRSKEPTIVEVPIKRNKRTGEIKQKSLGPNIGKITGTVGRAAVRALGIVIDADGRMRCPPGVPAANQFTDEIGSNCFDFTPSVGQALIAIAQRVGLRNLTNLAALNESLPIAKNEKGEIVALPRETYAAARRGARSMSTPLSIPDITPSGATSETSAGLRATAVKIERADYEKEFRKLIRAAYPDKSDSEIDELTALAVERARLQDAIDDEKRGALDFLRTILGKEAVENIDLRDPDQLRRALFEVSETIGVSLDGYFEGEPNDPADMARHNQKIHYGAVSIAMNKMANNHKAEYAQLVRAAGGERQLQRILLAGADMDAATILSKADADLTPEEMEFKALLRSEAGQHLWTQVSRGNNRIKEYEAGYFIGIMNQYKNNPAVARETIKWVGMVDWKVAHEEGNADINYDAQFMVMKRGKGTSEEFQMGILLNPISLLDTMRTEPEFPDEYTLFQAEGAGTEAAKLQKIASAVDRTSVERESREFLSGINTFREQKRRLDIGENNPQFVMEAASGTTARAQLIFHHETIHGRQVLSVYRYLDKLKSTPAGRDLAKLTSSDVLDLAADLVMPRPGTPMTSLIIDGQAVNYADMLADPKFFGGIIDDLPTILNDLFNRGTGGAYAKENMWEAVVLRSVLDGGTEKARISKYNELVQKIEMLKRTHAHIDEFGNETSEYRGTKRALEKIQMAYGSVGHSMRGEAWEQVSTELRNATAVAIMELQAEVGAGVAVGLIKRTPQIDALLAPLGTGYEDLPSPEYYIPTLNTREVNVPGLGSVDIQTSEGARRQAEFLKDEVRKFFGRKKRVAEAVRDGIVGARSSSSDDALVSEVLAGTVALKSRTEVSRWGRSIAERVLDAATTRQKQILSGKWQSARWNSADSGDWRNMLVLTPDQLVDSVESQLIPFTELVDSSVLPEGVAAEILLPNEIFDDDIGDISGTRFAIDNHFTGVVKSDGDLGVTDGPSSTTTRRMIIAVPEGFKGLPDKTPGSEGGEFGGLILPPGEIEIVGIRSDGTLIGRVVSQSSAEQHLNNVRQKLHSLETQQYRPLRERIAARKAVHKIDQGQRRRPAARAAAAVAMEMDPKNSKLASKIEYDPQERKLSVTFRDGKKIDFDDVGYGKVRDAGAKDDPDSLINELRSRGTMAQRGARSSSTVADSVISAGEDEDAAGRAWLEALNIPLQEPPPTMKPTTVQEAIKYALQGYAVDMPNVEGAHILLEEFGKIVAALEKLYEDEKISEPELKNFVFDLCNIHVANTSVFCADNQGIPRYMMPQAEGLTREGSIAHAKLMEKRAKKAAKMRELGFSEEEIKEATAEIKEINMAEEFKDWLKARGVEIGDVEKVDSSKLKASQRDMQGQKIVGMFGAEDLSDEERAEVTKQVAAAKAVVKKIEDQIKELVQKGDLDGARALHPKLKEAEDAADKISRRLWSPGQGAIFVSRDGYVIDGHHRWAAVLGKFFRGGSRDGTHEMPVIRVDKNILSILQLANEFTDEVGIVKKNVATVDGDADQVRAYTEKIMGLVAETIADKNLVEAGAAAAEARFDDYLKSEITRLGGDPTPRPKRPKKVVRTVEEGVEAMLNGYEVEMPTPQGAAVFIQEIGEMVASLREMKNAADKMRKTLKEKLKKEGKTDKEIDDEIEKILETTDGVVSTAQFKRFVFDLCQVTAVKASPFCLGNKGVPRYAMPQAAGMPLEDEQGRRLDTPAGRKFDRQVAELRSKVDTLRKDGAPQAEIDKAQAKLDKFVKEKEIDAADEFVEFLRKRGYIVELDEQGKPKATRVPTSQLRPTQGEMKGEQVAGMLDSYLKGTYDPSKKPIFITSDNFVIDGHHRYGAVAAADGLDGVLDNNHLMNVTVINGTLSEILPLANLFAREFGIAPKKVEKEDDIDEAKTKEFMKTIIGKINRHNSAVRGHDAVSMRQALEDDSVYVPKTDINTILSRTVPSSTRGARSMSSSRGEYPDDTTFKITDMPPDVKEFIRERRERAKKLYDGSSIDKGKESARVQMLERLENGYEISAFERDLLIDEMTRIEENWIRAGGIDMPRNQTYSAQERASAARLNAMLNRGNPTFRPAKGIDLRDIDVDHDSEFGPNAFWLPNIDGHAKNGRLYDADGSVVGKYNVPRGKEGLIEGAQGGYYFDARGNIVGTYEYFDSPISVASYGNSVRQQTEEQSVTIGRRLARRMFKRPKAETGQAPPSRRRPKRRDLYT